MSDGNLASDESLSPKCKKIKIDNENGNGVSENNIELKDFILEKILSNNTNRKTVCALGKFKDKSGVAIVILEKNAFKEEELDEKGYFSVETELRTFFQNDIYGNYECFPRSSINGVKATIIYPATEKHITKYSQQEVHIVLETPELYEKLTLPHIQKEQFNLQWVYNILEGKTEQDRIIHNNTCDKEGFILLPDLKWDGLTKETLYLLAIIRQRGIKSLRDLDEAHLPLLKRIRDEGKKKILEKYNVSGSQLRIYLHYQPSFYHLHIHFTYLRHEAPGIYAEKSHLLDTVIDNLEMMGSYYKKATLPFTIREMDNIFNVYETNGHIQRIKNITETGDKKMLVKDVFMELRSRLRSCNVYITTGIDFSKDGNLKISIKADCIVLNFYNNYKRRHDSLSSIESLSDCSEDETDVSTIIPIEEFCKIIPNSMSCLKIDKNTVSFRILTEPKNGGNFYKELLTPKPIESTTKESVLKINVTAGTDIKITCANCSNIVSNSAIKFNRVLELPTANLDMSEWFCHGHCHGNSSQNDVVLKPNKNDFLYRHTFFVINNNLMSQKTNKFNCKREVYHCNRCLAWLGIKEKDNIKLFNSEVCLHDNNEGKRVFTHKTSIGNIPKDDFIYTIEKVIKEFDLGFQYTVMCKILLECKMSATNKQYLLIWVMDKELQVLRNNDEHILNERIKLRSTFLTKLLYKVELTLNNEVESWISDPAVVTTDISKSMFNQGVEHLQEMSMKVPELFRNANGYFVSYLKV